jgi:S1-C subfamily serine protease
MVANGRVTKLVNEALIQTDAYVHNGYSGGGVFHGAALVGFQSFNIKVNATVLCHINFVYPIQLLRPILRDLLNG